MPFVQRVYSSFQRKLESSVFALLGGSGLKSLDPSFRWDDELEAA
jgi:hypothetical protein